MSRRWFQNTHGIDCDVVLQASGQTVQTVQMPVVPHVGDEMEFDMGGERAAGPLYRVVRVRHHLRPRRLTMRDDLFGVSVFVEPVG